MDHCRFRIYVIKGTGEEDLPWLTAIEDDYSRALMGYRLSWSVPSAIQTSLTLREAIGVKEERNWPMQGVPESFYADHGIDFTSGHMEAVAVDLKMALIFSQVKKPRGRGKVERFFRTVQEDFLLKLPRYAPKVKDFVEQQHANERERKQAYP